MSEWLEIPGLILRLGLLGGGVGGGFVRDPLVMTEVLAAMVVLAAAAVWAAADQLGGYCHSARPAPR